MRRWGFAIAALLLATPAKADWHYTHWGMSPEDVAAASNGAVSVLPEAERRVIETAQLEYAAQGTYEEGALLLDVRFEFDTQTGGLECVAYAVRDPAGNDLLEKSLEQLYGPPQETSDVEAIGMKMHAWTEGDSITFTAMTGERAAVVHCRE